MQNIICHICQTRTELAQAFTRDDTDFLICKRCGVVFRRNQPSLEELTSIYASHYAKDNIAEGSTRQESGTFALEAYYHFLVSNVCAGGKVHILDYGAGTGRLVELFLSAGYPAEGLEFAYDARQYCWDTRRIELSAGLNQNTENLYDLVTMIEVIEHLKNPMEDLAAIRGLLRPGGLLFITTPDRLGWRGRIEGSQWCEARKPFHLYLFDQASLTRLLNNSGFNLIRRVRFSPLTRPGLLRAFWGRCMQLFGLGGTICVIAQRQD